MNWSCKLGSAISDIEVDNLNIEKRTKIEVPGYSKKIEFGQIYDFAYMLQDETGNFINDILKDDLSLYFLCIMSL